MVSEQTAVPSDAATIASIRARQHGTVSTRPNAPPVEMRSALRVEDVDALLAIVERQGRLLAECAEALTIWCDWINLPFSRFTKLHGKASDDQWVAAIRELAEEVRR
jgi:hypothetical protein